MDVLVPIDGSECSQRALRFGIDLADRFDGSVHVVHITDHKTEATEELLDRARAILDEEDVSDDPEVLFDVRKFKAAKVIGKDILGIADEEGYDHIVMGHHGNGRIARALLGSAAETVIKDTKIPVTIVP